jgi:hypothetical protein
MRAVTWAAWALSPYRGDQDSARLTSWFAVAAGWVGLGFTVAARRKSEAI